MGSHAVTGVMDDCKIGLLEVHRVEQIRCEVVLPKAIVEFFHTPLVAPRMGFDAHLVAIPVLEHPWRPM